MKIKGNNKEILFIDEFSNYMKLSILNRVIYRGKKILRNSKNKIRTNEDIFTEIYQKKVWSGESKSGPGSDLEQTNTIRKEFPRILKEWKISSILDVPCGDFFWMKHVDLNSVSYIGGDLVNDIIKQNTKNFSNKNRKFVLLNILEDQLPQVDLVFCRDLLVHFSIKNIHRAIENIKKSKSNYLLTTSFVNLKRNKNITNGDWRPINLNEKPFNFPKPLQTINENYSQNDGKYSDKSLCLWRIIDL